MEEYQQHVSGLLAESPKSVSCKTKNTSECAFSCVTLLSCQRAQNQLKLPIFSCHF